MGLLAKVGAVTGAEKKSGDDVLLLHGMMLMAGADGVIEGAEIATLQGFYNTLPEFQGKDFDELLAEANKVVARFGSLKDSVKALGEIESDAVRKKLFVLSADLAMSTGNINENEDQLLDEMQKLLDVASDEAEKIVEVLALKYVT